MRRMNFKFAISTVILLFACLCCAFATVGPHTSQMIAGFINHEDSAYANLEITPDGSILSGRSGDYIGINLNTGDDNNPYKFILSPSMTHELGLRIASFYIEATNRSYEVRIYHTKLIQKNVQRPSSFDYELGVSYSLTGGAENRDYCVSTTTLNPTDDALNRISNKQMISMDLGGLQRVVLIRDGYFYFRLAEPVTVPGQYSSDVYVVLGTK